VRRFTGARWEPTSATYHLRARAYSPHLGLFLSRDPLGYVDSYDVWMYVGGNPFAFVDPLGMAAEDNPSGGRRRARPGGSSTEERPRPPMPTANYAMVQIGTRPVDGTGDAGYHSVLRIDFVGQALHGTTLWVTGTNSHQVLEPLGYLHIFLESAYDSALPADQAIEHWVSLGQFDGELVVEILDTLRLFDPNDYSWDTLRREPEQLRYSPTGITGYNCNGLVQGIVWNLGVVDSLRGGVYRTEENLVGLQWGSNSIPPLLSNFRSSE
jgi:RHS repeat-associated protein